MPNLTRHTSRKRFQVKQSRLTLRAICHPGQSHEQPKSQQIDHSHYADWAITEARCSRITPTRHATINEQHNVLFTNHPAAKCATSAHPTIDKPPQRV